MVSHKDQCWNFYFLLLDGNIGGPIYKFADDTKIEGIADREKCCKSIQQNVDHLEIFGREMADGV